MPNGNSLEISTTMNISLFTYFLISIGVGLQIGGSNWDIVWHGIGNVESFFTPPHSVIYSGVALSIISIIFRIISFSILQIKKINNSNLSINRLIKLRSIIFPFPLKLCIIGVVLQLTAGPFDFWWHNSFGFDGLLSPPHAVLATGMLMAAIGGLIGIYRHLKDDYLFNITKAFLVISFGIYLMVVVGLILMFTLPFSKGQYFNFNPDPFVAMISATIFIPFIMGISLFLISSKLPFVFTSVSAVIITVQAATTILSNSYFAWLFPYYILNMIPPICADIIILYRNNKINRDKKRVNGDSKTYIFTSMLVSSFFLFLFFPWTVDVFAGFFKPSDDVRTEEFLTQILLPVVLPFIIPISLLASYMGTYFIQRVNKTSLVKMIEK